MTKLATTLNQKEKFTADMAQILKSVVTKEGTIATCFSTFWNYSIKNQFLAYWQASIMGIEVSPLCSFKGWNKLNRKVMRGQKAIYLWQPFFINIKEEDAQKDNYGYITRDKNGQLKKLIFKYKPSWFMYSQTEDCDDRFKINNAKTVDDLKPCFDNFDFNKVYDYYGIKLVPFHKVDGNVQGYANVQNKELAINPLAEHVELTIVHEIAHIALEHDKYKKENKNDDVKALKELEAETVAYIVGTILKVPEKYLAECRGYVQGWFGQNEIPQYNASRIMRIANEILKVGYGLKLKDTDEIV